MTAVPDDVLPKLFGSAGRVRVMRLFLLNPSGAFSPKEIASKCAISSDVARREVNFLRRIGLIKQAGGASSGAASVSKAGRKKKVLPKKSIKKWNLNEFFSLVAPLRKLIVESVTLDRKKILKSIQSSGKIRLIVLSGVFTGAPESRLDILIVGDGIKKRKIESVIGKIEAEVGKDIVYAVFSTSDFLYRLDMYDKFIFGILDYPHEKLLNKLISGKI